MTTALDIITDSYLELGVISEGETPDASMTSSGLRTLNRLMDYLSNGKDFAFYPALLQQALTGEASFTIGASGADLTATRPISIETAYVTRDGVNQDVRVLDNVLWDSITTPGTTGGDTVYIWYEATMPNGIVHVYPLATGCTLSMRVITQVATFATTATVLSLPPGYEECLVSNLAVRLKPKYPTVKLDPVTVQYARSSLRAIRQQNSSVPTLALPNAVIGRRGYSHADFLAGG